MELFTKKIVKKLFKIWSWDPRSGIRKKTIPDPGSRGQKGPGSGSTTLVKGIVQSFELGARLDSFNPL
jgi:hypothetical protein